MPAPRFFVMVEAIERIRGKELAQACYVARSARLENEAFSTTVEEFAMTGEAKIRPIDIDIPVKKQKPLTHAEQTDAVFAMFSADHRISRKVMRHYDD